RRQRGERRCGDELLASDVRLQMQRDELSVDLMGDTPAIVVGLRLAGALTQTAGILSRMADHSRDDQLAQDLGLLIGIAGGRYSKLNNYAGQYLKIEPMAKKDGFSMEVTFTD